LKSIKKSIWESLVICRFKTKNFHVKMQILSTYCALYIAIHIKQTNESVVIFFLRFKNNAFAKFKNINESMKMELNEMQRNYTNARKLINTMKTENKIQLHSVTIPEVQRKTIIELKLYQL